MAALLPLVHRRPPRLYRFARLFRRLSLVALVVVIVFLGSVVYSAVRLAQSSPQSGGYTAGFDANGTVAVTGSLSLSNPGYYPLEGFVINLRVLNDSGTFLGNLQAGPVTVPAGNAASFPFAMYLPVSAGSAAESLLTQDQYLAVGIWGNATYAYLFPISVHFAQSKFWGAPFDMLHISPGTPIVTGGTVTVPVTVSFTNQADFTEFGTLSVTLYPPAGKACGGTTFALNVPSQTPFDQTQDVELASGCTVAGGYAEASYSTSGQNITFPPQALP